MPSVTHDGRSFMIDGRRVWLVAGRVPYARLPRDTWADRIHAAKQAGFNTIESPVFWNRHESRPGRFDFTGENDLRHFIDLIGKAGMYCILGIGPYIGCEWDMGGLPSWLRETGNAALRTANGPYLEACSRYITAVADQIRGWQVTAPGTGGPIILMQCESEWTCGHETLAAGYLGELTRYIREAGLAVPLVNSNNLWQGVEGQIDGWSGGSNMLATMRQLASVRPDGPRIVIDLALTRPDTWGRAADPGPGPAVLQRRLAEVLAGGGQFNISTFCGGTNFGFFGGRLPDAFDSFAATSSDRGALIDEAGRPGPAYGLVRRLATFASRFGRVLANLDPAYQPITVRPAEAAEPGDGAAKGGKARGPVGAGPAVVHAMGSQGGVAFVFNDDLDAAPGQRRTLQLVLPDGSPLPVTLGEQSVAWCLFDVNVSGRSRLDYSNVSALGNVGGSLVCFGPAGSRAMLSVNGSPVEALVPVDGAAPTIVEHEGLTLIIVNEAQADTTYLGEDAVYAGVAGLDPEGAPIAAPGSKSYLRITPDGRAKTVAIDPPHRARASGDKLALGGWSAASVADYADGTSARYAKVAGPADLVSLGCAYGYGWYRLTLNNPAAHKARLLFPHAGDRLHIFADGKPAGVIGVGPGAAPDAPISLRKGSQQLVVLADNLGRFSGGANLGEGKGLFGEIYESVPVKTAKPRLVPGQPVGVLAFRAPLWELSDGDATSPDRLTWTLAHRRKTPVIVTVAHPPAAALLLVNDKPVAYLDRSGPRMIVLSADALGKASNTIQLALVGAPDSDEDLEAIAEGVRFDEGAEGLIARAEIAFAKWEPPATSAYGPPPKTGRLPGPAWWRCPFTVDRSGEPVHFEPAGMTKGQVYVNGRHLGRYFVATADGTPVPPQHRLHLPASWLRPGQPNELVLFDEHGGTPTKSRLVHG